MCCGLTPATLKATAQEQCCLAGLPPLPAQCVLSLLWPGHRGTPDPALMARQGWEGRSLGTKLGQLASSWWLLLLPGEHPCGLGRPWTLQGASWPLEKDMVIQASAALCGDRPPSHALATSVRTWGSRASRAHFIEMCFPTGPGLHSHHQGEWALVVMAQTISSCHCTLVWSSVSRAHAGPGKWKTDGQGRKRANARPRGQDRLDSGWSLGRASAAFSPSPLCPGSSRDPTVWSVWTVSCGQCPGAWYSGLVSRGSCLPVLSHLQGVGRLICRPLPCPLFPGLGLSSVSWGLPGCP